MFLIPGYNWKTLLFIKVDRYSEIFSIAILFLFFFAKSQCLESKSYFMFYFHNNSRILIPRFQNKANSAAYIFAILLLW